MTYKHLKTYDHLKVEEHWQRTWSEKNCFRAKDNLNQPKYYALDMFPYPSGAGLHVGHLASYTPTDIVARYKRARGFNVLHPFGYDAFGLPAEQYAIQTGVHPEKTTKNAIVNFRKQLQSFGYSFDWSREISTCDPKFYKWTQFIFKKLYKKNLAYQREVPVNWCPALKTVLANEEVIDGKSERGGHPVIRKPMKQWMLKITAYAERLLKDLEKVDWPEKTKEGQRNWIGRSEGMVVRFAIHGHQEQKLLQEILQKPLQETLEVYTTRPDTLFGCTFMVVAPEHPCVAKITTTEQKSAVEKYVQQSLCKSEVNRKADTEKTGVFTGRWVINPVNGEKLPIWIADYVLMDYGTGAIMAVPGHDTRDFEFATKFDLPIRRVLLSEEPLPFEGDGKLVHSDFLNDLEKAEAIDKVTEFLESKGLGQRKIQYKLRDWLFSRQRYWGEPFPMVYLKELGEESTPRTLSEEGTHQAPSEKGTLHTLSDEELPVTLPQVADYEPTEDGAPPLAKVPDFVNYQGASGRGIRDTDTMPGSAGSSWYFLRYLDPNNDKTFCELEKQKYWMPVDLYVGGAEHTVGHLLYARFWQKVLFDAGLTTCDEPFQRLVHQGVILGPDGQRMSKSRGNVINPDEIREKYGADTTRVYICFLGPFEKDKPWNTSGMEGIRRFLERVWRLCVDEEGKGITDDSSPENFKLENSNDSSLGKPIERLLHKTVKKVGEDIEDMNFNTAISAMMILVNELYKQKTRPRKVLQVLVQLLMPFAPHISEELWSRLGGNGLVSLAPWPQYNENLARNEIMTMGVQVNGKMRGTIEVSEITSQDEATTMAKSLKSVQMAIGDKTVVKTIYKVGRILNFITH